ncbi:rhodanese [Haloferax prahovense DSM 18310]|uniref:Rhodanese n=1 Tax=Haloferax prahovense (strain DSM 18310 / JCM 13924 / TL6) TaxID=1227461 RepID=M0GEN5_HALPT|nr:rhodanese-like domain-containing protein [Haloferax prahovense]ELZ69289.1 rhodanese [Haloferax prahovense DSM 18310]
MTTIRPDELDARLADGDDLFILDIRPESNYQRGAIDGSRVSVSERDYVGEVSGANGPDGSRNVPVYDDLRSGDDASLRGRLDEIPRDRDVVVVCKMGIVAKRATELLREEGYDAATLAGGMSGWNGYQRGSLSYKLRSLIWRLF